MEQRNKDLFLILIITIVSIVLVFPLVFLTPGYLLMELLAYKRAHDGATRLLLSIGLSLSIDILGGFLLNIIPAGLTTLTWDVFLGALTIICMLLCMVKRRQWQIPANQKQKDLPTFCEFLLLTLTISIVVLAFMYTTNTIANQEYQGFTQFWLLLDNHQSHICTIQTGIYSSEVVTTTYQVVVKENNQRAAHWSSITLAPQQEWQGQLPIAINPVQASQLQIEADLYRQQAPNSVYRTVQLLLLSSQITCIQAL